MIESTIGFLIALAIGLTGIAGGTLTAPVLVLLLGITAGPAVGTGGLHLSLGSVEPAILYKLIAGGIAGVMLGAHLASVVPARKPRLGLSMWLMCLGSHCSSGG